MIAFLINEIDVCGGTHKQFLKLIEYAEKQRANFIVITKVLDLANTYPEFASFKDKIYVCSPNYEWKGIFKIRKLRKIAKNYYHIKYIRKIKGLTKKIDVINIHDNGWENEWFLFRRKKVIWQVNDFPYWFGVGPHSNLVQNEEMQRLQKQTIQRLKYITDITVNVNKNANLIKKLFNRNAHVFYCGIEPIFIDKKLYDTIARFAEKKINLLTSGVFFPYRNYETQIKVVNSLMNNGYDVHLDIIGKEMDVQYANKIRTIIDQQGLQKNITIHGQVSDDVFKYLHLNADIFLFINIDQSWGLAVFEAMSCGLPVIVSESVGATEILTNGSDAITVNPINVSQISNAILDLVNSTTLYRILSKNASCFHQKWSWDSAYCSKMWNLLTDNTM